LIEATFKNLKIDKSGGIFIFLTTFFMFYLKLQGGVRCIPDSHRFWMLGDVSTCRHLDAKWIEILLWNIKDPKIQNDPNDMFKEEYSRLFPIFNTALETMVSIGCINSWGL